MNYIVRRAHISTIGPLGKNIAFLKLCHTVGQDYPADWMSARISHIRDLIRLRDGIDQLDVLNHDQLQEILVYACTS